MILVHLTRSYAEAYAASNGKRTAIHAIFASIAFFAGWYHYDAFALVVALFLFVDCRVLNVVGMVRFRFFADLLVLCAIFSLALGLLMDEFLSTYHLPIWADWTINWIPRLHGEANIFIAMSRQPELEFLKLKYAACIGIVFVSMAILAFNWRRCLDQTIEIVNLGEKERPIRELVTLHVIFGIVFVSFGIFDFGSPMRPWRNMSQFSADFPAPTALVVGLMLGLPTLAAALTMMCFSKSDAK